MIRVLITDDEPLIRAGIRLILTSAEDIEVVAEAGNGREALDLAQRHQVDVVLLDIQMPVLDGLATLPELRRTVPTAKPLILTTFGERENVLAALRQGGAGFLLKDSAPDELMRAVRATAAGDAYLSPSATRYVIDNIGDSGAQDVRTRQARQRLAELTPRESQVLRLLGEGRSNADIGGALHMSEATVKSYVSRILAKLDCGNRVQAALLARDAGLGG